MKARIAKADAPQFVKGRLRSPQNSLVMDGGQSMASSGKGKTLVADRRPAAPAKRKTAKAPAPRKPRKPKRGLVARFVLFLWGIIWALVWRVGAVSAMILGCAVLFFYVQMPPLETLLDGRARGSVTLQDRNGDVYAWRGETYGGQDSDVSFTLGSVGVLFRF